MKRSLILLAMVAMLASAWPAAAQQRPRPERRFDRGSTLSEPRQAPQRGERPPAREAGWQGHMSPEERRQLRRDIDEHGRDLYRERREKR